MDLYQKEYYYDGRLKGVQKTDEEYAKDMIEFIGDKKNKIDYRRPIGGKLL